MPNPLREPGRRGPPSTLTVLNAGKVLAHVRNGLWRYNAAALIGVSHRTIEGWVARGNKEILAAEAVLERTGAMPKLKRYGQFVVDLLAAEAEVEGKLVGVVFREAVYGTDAMARIHAAKWLLERRNNLRCGSGAQRTAGRRPGAGDDDVVDDAAPFVIDALKKFVAQEQAKLGPSAEE